MECNDEELTRARKFLLINPGPNGRFTFGNIKPLDEITNDPEIAKEASKFNMTQSVYIKRIRECVNAAEAVERRRLTEAVERERERRRLAAAVDGGKRRSHRRKHGRRNTRGKRSKCSKRN